MKALAPVLAAAVALTAATAADDYQLGPESQPQAGVPKGVVTKHRLAGSKVYPGTERDHWVCVPAGHDSSKAATVTIFQDGQRYVSATGHTRAPIVFDNLIHKREIPPTIGVFVHPGVIPAAKEGGVARNNRIRLRSEDAPSKGDSAGVDSAGRYYVTSDLGVQMFDPTGRRSGVILAPDPRKPLVSLTFAGAGLHHLYVAYGDAIYRRNTKATGSGR